MTPERYDEADRIGKLTQAEVRQGWRFCCEFDGLLIGKNWLEATYCTCYPAPWYYRLLWWARRRWWEWRNNR